VELLAAGGVHLGPDNPFDLVDGPPSQGKDAIDASGELGHETRPQRQLVADGLCVGGDFSEGLTEEL